jgi:4-aminobutyrate aminotransferase-like enzyme
MSNLFFIRLPITLSLSVWDGKVIGSLMKNKLLMLPSGDNAIRFRPHLNVTKEDLTTSLEIIYATIKDTLN